MKADAVEFLHLLREIYFSYLNEEAEYKRMSAAVISSVKSDSNIRITFDFTRFQFDHTEEIRLSSYELEQISALTLSRFKVFSREHLIGKYEGLKTINTLMLIFSIVILAIFDYIGMNLWFLGMFIIIWFLSVIIYAYSMLIKLNDWEDFYHAHKVYLNDKLLKKFNVISRLSEIFGRNKLGIDMFQAQIQEEKDMFGLSTQEVEMKNVFAAFKNSLQHYYEEIAILVSIADEMSDEEKEDFFVSSRKHYFDIAKVSLFEHLRKEYKDFDSKFNSAVTNPNFSEMYGMMEIETKGYTPGTLFYYVYVAITGKEPKYSNCISLNHAVNSLMDQVLQKIDEESVV